MTLLSLIYIPGAAITRPAVIRLSVVGNRAVHSQNMQ